MFSTESTTITKKECFKFLWHCCALVHEWLKALSEVM